METTTTSRGPRSSPSRSLRDMPDWLVMMLAILVALVLLGVSVLVA